jgi:dTDP-D-glucose 4,6-dehydratase
MNPKSANILITGGASFIGSALIRHIINNTNHNVINIDKLTYAGNLDSFDSVIASKISDKLGWMPNETFETGIQKMVEWYLKNTAWSDRVKNLSYQGERLGVIRN